MLGMIILSAASLSNMDECFNYAEGKLLDDKILEKIENLRKNYDENIINFILKMIE